MMLLDLLSLFSGFDFGARRYVNLGVFEPVPLDYEPMPAAEANP